MEEIKGYVHSVESFGSVDGPGVRYIVFLSGCPLRCKFCHNPDTWKMESGEQKTASEILEKAIKFKPYWNKTGGITVSGGEPLMQIDFLIDLFTKAKEKGINTCIDTSGAPFTKEGEWFGKFKRLMEVTDILLMDIKHIDDKEHVELTGKPRDNIREMFEYLSDTGKPIWIRHVLVPGVTDNDAYLTRTRDFIRTLKNVHRVEILPYHTLGVTKYKELGLPNRLEGVTSPGKERIFNAKKILECDRYTLWESELSGGCNGNSDTDPANASGRQCC